MKTHPIGHSHAVRAALGLDPKAKLPSLGLPPRDVAGYTLWVEPLGPNPTRHKRSTHRVMARCNACGRVLSAGRLHQHVCKKEASSSLYTSTRYADELPEADFYGEDGV